MKNKEMKSRFLEYIMNEKRYSENSVIAYQNDIDTFFAFLEKEDLGDVESVSETIAEFYIAYLYGTYKPVSIARKISGINSFYNYFVKTKVVENNPFANISLPKKEKRLPKFAYEKEIMMFLDSIDASTILGKRNAAIFELLYSSGLRVSELVNIKLNDIDFYKKTLLVFGKGQKERLVPIDNTALEKIENYLILARPSFLAKTDDLDNPYLFLNNKGTRLTDRGVRLILDSELNKTCLSLKITPHTFRHSFATHLLNNGMDIRMVQELLGHINLSTTQVYTKMSMENLMKIYNDSHPMGKKKK